MIINAKISNYGRKSIQEELNQRKYKGRKESEDQQYRTLNKQQNLNDYANSQRRGLSIVQRNMQQTNIIESTQTNTQFYYEISSAPSMILVTKPKFIIANSSFQLVMLLSKPIRVELSLNVELYVSGFSIASSSKCILDSNSQDNQNYFCRFSSLSYVGDYLIRYWISNTLTSEKISNIMMISDIVSVLPIPLLKSVEPNLLGIDAYSVYFPVRLFGENLKTDFAIVWFGDKAQTTFSASKDGTYIDVNAPVFSLSNDQDRVNVKVYIEVNENQFMTNSISVTYFRLSVRRIYYVCKIQSQLCSQENEVVYNNGQLIRYANPLLVETLTGTFSASEIQTSIFVDTNLQSRYTVTPKDNKNYGIIELNINIQGVDYFVGKLQVVQPFILVSLDKTSISQGDSSCLTINVVQNQSPIQSITAVYYVFNIYNQVVLSGNLDGLIKTSTSSYFKQCNSFSKLEIGRYYIKILRNCCNIPKDTISIQSNALNFEVVAASPSTEASVCSSTSSNATNQSESCTTTPTPDSTQADGYSYDYHKIFIRSDTAILCSDSMISIQSFGFNAMFDAYCMLNVSSIKFEFSSSDDKSGACIFGSFFSTYKDFTTPVKLEMYSKIIRYSDSKVDEVYGYNSSSQSDYSALFYVVDQIKITSLNYTESVSSAYLNRSVNVFLNPVQIPSSLLKNTKCTLTEYIEPYSILQGEVASQLTSRNVVTITDIAGYLHNIECVFEINFNDASKYTISIDISSFHSEFNSRLISIIQNPKIINVNSLTYMYDYSIVGSKSEDIMFQIIYEGQPNIYCKFQTKTQNSLSTIQTSQAIFLKNIDTGPLGSQLIDEVSILQYSCAIDWLIISKFPGSQIYLSVYTDEQHYSNYLYSSAGQSANPIKAVLYQPSEMMTDFQFVLQNSSLNEYQFSFSFASSNNPARNQGALCAFTFHPSEAKFYSSISLNGTTLSCFLVLSEQSTSESSISIQLLLDTRDPVLFYTSETGISSELSVPLAVQQFRKSTDSLNLATKTVEFSNSDSSQDLPTLIWNITNNVETTPQSCQFLNQGGSLIVETEAVVSKSIVSCKLADRRYFFASSDIKCAQYQVLINAHTHKEGMSWKFGPYTIQVCQLPIVINTNYVGDSLEYQLNNAYTQEEIASQFICTYSNPEYSGVTLVEGAKYKSADTVLCEFQCLASVMPSEYCLKISQWILKCENVVCSLPCCLPGNAIPNISVAKAPDNQIYDSSAVSVSKLINSDNAVQTFLKSGFIFNKISVSPNQIIYPLETNILIELRTEDSFQSLKSGNYSSVLIFTNGIDLTSKCNYIRNSSYVGWESTVEPVESSKSSPFLVFDYISCQLYNQPFSLDRASSNMINFYLVASGSKSDPQYSDIVYQGDTLLVQSSKSIGSPDNLNSSNSSSKTLNNKLNITTGIAGRCDNIFMIGSIGVDVKQGDSSLQNGQSMSSSLSCQNSSNVESNSSLAEQSTESKISSNDFSKESVSLTNDAQDTNLDASGVNENSQGPDSVIYETGRSYTQLLFMNSTNGNCVTIQNASLCWEGEYSPQSVGMISPTLFELFIDLSEITQLNNHSQNKRIALSVVSYSQSSSTYLKLPIQSVTLNARLIKGSFDIIRFMIDPQVHPELLVNFKLGIAVTEIECSNCDFAAAYCDNTILCPKLTPPNIPNYNSKIFMPCESNYPCLADFIDLDILQSIKDRITVNFAIVKDDVFLMAQRTITIRQSYYFTNYSPTQVIYGSQNSIFKIQSSLLRSYVSSPSFSLNCALLSSAGALIQISRATFEGNLVSCSIDFDGLDQQETKYCLLEQSNSDSIIVSNNATISVFKLEIISASPILSPINGGATLTLVVSRPLTQANSIVLIFGGSVYVDAKKVSDNTITCVIPAWRSAELVDVQISIGLSHEIVGPRIKFRYCSLENCANEYLCKYILQDYNEETILYQEIDHESKNSSSQNNTNYCQGNQLPYTGKYYVQVSVDNGETFVSASNDHSPIWKNISTFDILEITPNTLLIPGLNLIQITTNRVITPTEGICEILLFRNLNTTFEMKSKATGDLNILCEYDSTLWYREIEFDKIAIRIRLKNERIQTKWTLISVKTNSILIDVAPRILWSVPTTINSTSAMRSELLPQKLYLSINQFSFMVEKAYCIIFWFSGDKCGNTYKIYNVNIENNDAYCEISDPNDFTQNLIDENLGLYLTKDLNVPNCDFYFNLTITPIPLVESFEILTINMNNNTISELSSLSGVIHGTSFRQRSVPLWPLSWDDSYGRKLKFDTANLFFISSNTLDVIIDDPLKVENLLNVVRVKEILPSSSSIIFGSQDNVLNSPTQIKIVFSTPIKQTDKIKAYFQHWLDGTYQLSFVGADENFLDQTLIDSIHVEIPQVSVPKIMELYFDPILESRIVFDKSTFEYKLSESVSGDLFANSTSITEDENTLFPKIFSVSPATITPDDNLLSIEGVNLESNIFCEYMTSSITKNLQLINSSFGYCDINWNRAQSSEIVSISNGSMLYQATLEFTDNSNSICSVQSYYLNPASVCAAWFTTDNLFSNNSTSQLILRSISPTVLREGESQSTSITVLGEGIETDYEGKLTCAMINGNGDVITSTASVQSSESLLCPVPNEVFKFSAQNIFVKLQIQFENNQSYLNLYEFEFIALSIIRNIQPSNVKMLHYKQKSQKLSVKLEDSSGDILSSLINDKLNKEDSIEITYSCSFLNSTHDLVFSEPVIGSAKLLQMMDYPSVKYYNFECLFPWLDQSIQPTSLVIVQHLKISGVVFDFQSNSVEIQVIVQPKITNILPSNFFAFGSSGDITVSGANFNVNLPMYLRLSFEDHLYMSTSEASTLTSTSATFHIDKTMIPFVGTYNLEISQYPELFCEKLSLQIFLWTQEEAESECEIAELNVVSVPEILEASPLNIPAQSSGRILTIRGSNFTQFTLCEIGGNLISTTFINDDILQCEIPIGIYGDTITLKLNERGLYSVNQNELVIEYTAEVAITQISPSVIFSNGISIFSSSGNLVKVYVTDFPSSSEIELKYDSMYLPYVSMETDEAGLKYISFQVPSLISEEKQISVEIVICGGVTYGASIPGANTITILSVPILTSVSPRFVPRYIEYPPDQEIPDEYLLVISGSGFSNSISYQCSFEYGSNIKLIDAVFVNATSIKCRPPDFVFEAYVSLRVYAVYGSGFTYAQGTLSLMLYEPPTILRMYPVLASFDEGLSVSLAVSSLPFTAGIKCRFGGYTQSFASVYRQGKLVVCDTPIISSSNSLEITQVSISPDGLFWFSSLESFTFFTPPTFTGVDNLLIPPSGKDYITVFGTNFYNSGNILGCRMKLTENEYFDMQVSYIQDSEIRCLKPTSYMIPIANITLFVSFNRAKFYQVSSSLQYACCLPENMEMNKYFGSPTPSDNIITMTGINLNNATLVSEGGFDQNIVFTPSNDTSGIFTFSKFVNISSLTGAPYAYKCFFEDTTEIERYCSSLLAQGEWAWCFLGTDQNHRYSYLLHKESNSWTCQNTYPRVQIEIGIDGLGFSSNGVSYMLLQDPSLLSIEPQSVQQNTPTKLLVKGVGFWKTDSAKCRVRVNSSTFYLIELTYINSTAIYCSFPAFSDTSANYSIGITLNGFEYTNQTDEIFIIVNEPITIISIYPVAAFKSQTNITILVEASPIPDNINLDCIVQDFSISGTKIASNGNEYLQCVIPSFEAIKDSSITPIPSSGEVNVTIGSNGVNLSSNSMIFIFLDSNQVDGITPANGPDTGGTVLTVTVAVDQTLGDIGPVYCSFPASKSVSATPSPPFNYLCTTPAFDQTLCDSTYDCKPELSTDQNTLDNMMIVMYPDYAIVQIGVIIAGNVDRTFQFTYNRNVEVDGFEPPFGFYNQSYSIVIKGVNFHPHVNIMCKYSLDTVTAIDANYLTNKTISCDIPSLPSGLSLPFYSNIEISLNGGLDYTSSGKTFAYCEKAVLNSLNPVEGQVTGNTKININYGSPGVNSSCLDILDTTSNPDLTSARVRCIFTLQQDPTKSYTTMVQSHDTSNKIISCSTPSANNIDSNLFVNGGIVLVSLTGSDESFEFTYEPIPVINSISPRFIFTDDNVTLSIQGENFNSQDASLLKVTLYSQDVTSIKVPISVTSTEILVTINSNEFLPRSRIDVKISFNQIDFYNSPQFISVSKRFSLDKLSQDFVSSGANKILVYIVEDVESAGGVWDTQNNLKCAFNGETIIEQAVYISSTIISCDLPTVSEATIDVKVIVDQDSNFESTNTLNITYVSSPTAVSIIDTGIFFQVSGQMSLLYSSNSQRIVTLSGSGFMNAPNDQLYVYFPDGQLTEVTATTDIKVDIPLPILEPGSTISKVFLSIDKNSFTSFDLSKNITIDACPSGSYCDLTTVTQCNEGEFCPLNQVSQQFFCGPGYVQISASSTLCNECETGKFCPFAKGVELDCISGFTCTNTTSRIEADLSICPEGFVCDSTTTSTDVSSGIGNTGNPQACPNGLWCGEGVYDLRHISGDLKTPQICDGGVVCGQNIDGSSSTTLPGSKDPHGSYPCSVTKYCTDGVLRDCPQGSFCPNENLDIPETCPSGSFSVLDQASCTKCSIGTYCPYQGTKNPVKCAPGNVCYLDGQIGMSRLCPAGSYCVLNVITKNTNDTNFAEEYIPIFCKAGTYCLAGVYTPIVNSSNPQAAQNCIEGSYCPEGTNSPEGIPCPPGYYCPRNAALPVPTDPGYFAEGEGNVQQEPCPPGTYSNQTAVSSCLVCPAGYQCTSEATTTPQLCPAGSYKNEDANLIFCQLCPQGTWSNMTGLTDVSQCIDCIPGIACIIEGMTSLSQAIDCPEGYICSSYKTTSFTMFNNPCPAGYYCGTKTAKVSEYHLCDRELYCPSASTSTGRTQNKCLIGYFCPLGTAATVNAQGTFDTVYEVQPGLELEGTSAYPACPENQALPQELIDQYLNNGTQLKCPDGTTSPRGSYCIGQCKTPSTPTVVATFNPVNGSSTIDGATDSFGENSTNSRRNLDDSLNSPLYQYSLNPLESAKVYFDFSQLPQGFNYNEHFKVNIQDSEGNDMVLPSYFSTSNDIANKNLQLEIRVHNMQNQAQVFTFSIELLHGLFSPYKIYLKNKAFVFVYYAKREIVGENVNFAFIISSTFLNGITIPYNAPNVGNDQSFFLDMTAQIGLLPSRGYTKDVFDSTYWQSLQVTTVVMSWFPFFSNCEGYDTKIIFYDIMERDSRCILPSTNDIKVVDPIPISGLYPTADKCIMNLKCRYDEVLDSNVATTTRWYQIQTSQTLFMVTEDPVDLNTFFAQDPNSAPDSAFDSDIADGSDSLIDAILLPQVSGGLPGNITLQILYYQMDQTTKRIVTAKIILSDYTDVTEQDSAVYTLKVEYRAMDFFELVNNFQFSIFIYILLFSLVTVVLFIGIIIVWALNLLIARRKKPPVIKFMHMARVTFWPPTFGAILASIPVAIAAGIMKLTENISIFDNVDANWSNLQQPVDTSMIQPNRRGRLGLQLIIVGFVCLFYGANVMISRPTKSEETEILKQKKNERINEQKENTLDGSESSMYQQSKEESEEEEEEEVRIRDALAWKRRHFIMMCLVIAAFVMLKIQFSYTQTFQGNIYTFLVVFMITDIILEQILTRIVMSESLLVTPILAAFNVIEFVMTMGAVDFQSFVISFFIETALTVAGRVYIGPAVEKIELYSQKLTIWLSLKFRFFERICRKTLRRQLLIQTQLQNLSEFHHFNRNRHKESGEGMEALLGSVVSYSTQVQALFITPLVLVFVIFFAQETKIAINYSIRKSDLDYYLVFTIIIVFPQLAINIFLLHILEVLHGFKIYDYLTYCDFRFICRTSKWINQQPLDRSVLPSHRSLDNMSFCSQYYFIATLVTWGILLIDLGLVTIIENTYNPFNDPYALLFIFIIVGFAVILKLILSTVSGYVNLWKLKPQNDHLKLDTRAITILDKEHDMRRLLNLIHNHHGFRHKFIRVNRAWVIENLAKVLTRDYVMKDDEEKFLLNVYQEAVNADAVEERLKKEQAKIQKALAMMPYNRKDIEVVEVSDDSISDIPLYNWKIPPTAETIPKI